MFTLNVPFSITLLAFGANALAAPQFSITVLPLTAAAVSNQARGVNDLGLVTGYENTASGFQRAVTGTANATVGAGLPAYLPSITSSEAHSVNNNGIVVGVGRYSAPAPGSTTGSVAYDRGIVFNANTNQYLSVIEPFNSSGGRRAFAQDINDRNRVIGNGSSDAVLTNQNPRQGFWYDVSPTQALSPYKLDPLVNGLPFLATGNWNVAYGINESQQITGFSQTLDDSAISRNRAVVWNAGAPDSNGNPYTTVTRIDARNVSGTSSLARSINDSGVVVGRMTFSTGFADEAAFVYRSGDSNLTSLGFFGGARTEALDINNQGWIVGYAGNTEGDSSPINRALLWLPEVNVASGYKAFDLNDLVSLGSVLTGGWTKLLEARSINENGSVVGYGRYVASPGGAEVTRGFILATVPSPSSLSLICLAILIAGTRRKLMPTLTFFK